jgi:hypothetical protein
VRDYLYLWHDPKKRCVVTSGIELKDIAARIGPESGLLLLTHKYEDALYDSSGFEFVPPSHLAQLQEADVDSWGDVRWVDYAHPCYTHPDIPRITKKELAELLYFNHTGKPYKGVAMPSLKNRFLAAGHDDGWRLQIYYHQWSDIVWLLGSFPWFAAPDIRARTLNGKAGAFWINASGIEVEEATFDIDSIMNRRSAR